MILCDYSDLMAKYFALLKTMFFSRDIKSDVIAGVTVSLILIPQSMAYAQLAGLPPYYGLYASLIPPVLAALFGSSNHLSTGPVAIASLMTAAALAPLATSESEYLLLAGLLALLLGIVQMSFGFLRLGVLVNLLSHPVIVGFTNAAAIIIATSQLPKLFGITVGTSEKHYETVLEVLETARYETHLPTLIVATSTFFLMLLLRRVSNRLPYILIALVVATGTTWALDYHKTATVPLNSIQAPELIEKVTLYNWIYDEKQAIESTRAAVISQKETGLATHDDAVRIEGAILELDTAIIQADEQLALLLAEINSYRFSYDDVQQTALLSAGPDENWHITPPNTAFNIEAITLTGGGAIIGSIPQGLPKFTLPALSVTNIFSLFTTSVIIALIAFAEAIAVAQAIAAKTKQRIDANKELIGQGVANIAAAFTQGYPVAGSFSRSAVNIQAGAKTKLSSAVTSFIVLLTLLFFTGSLYHIPQAALAAIIILAVSGLINPNKIRHIWHTSRHDAFAAVLTFISTLYFAPELEVGLAIGIAFSLIFYLYQNSRPKVSFLSVYRDGHLHDAKRFELAQCENIAVVRFEAPLFFANANILEQEILKELISRPKIQQILIVGSAMVNVDATGEEKISELVDLLRENGKDVYFSALQTPVIDVFKKTGLLKKIGKKHLFISATEAIEYLAHHTPDHTDEEHCPLLNYIHEASVKDRSRIHAVKDIMSNFYRIFGPKQLLRLKNHD